MNIYLKVKHWHLLILLMLVPNILGLSFRPYSSAIAELSFWFIFLSWIWAISSACYKSLPKELVRSPKRMRVAIFYVWIFGLISYTLFANKTEVEPPVYFYIMSFLALFSICYAVAFTAKQLTKLEQQKDVSFFSYLDPFLCFILFPFGIWFIQPKVNRLLGKENV